MQNLEIGISLASYLPRSALFPIWAIDQAREAKYDFIQMLPLRGLWINNLRIMDPLAQAILPIKYVENTWNTPPATLAKAIQGWAQHDPTVPLLLWFVFGQHAESVYESLRHITSSKVIVHSFDEKPYDLIEIMPSMWMGVSKIIDRLEETKTRIVVDTFHLRQDATPEWLANRPAGITSKNLLGKWEETLPRLLPYADVIHIQPHRDTHEFRDCLSNRSTELGEMLDCVRESEWFGDLVVEAAPSLDSKLGFVNVAGALRDFRLWVIEQMMYLK